MRAFAVILIVFGIVALLVPSVTFFTTERVADIGFFKVDVSRPHTIIFNPIAGVVALGIGALLLTTGRRSVS